MAQRGRDEAVSEVAAGWIAAAPLTGPVLVVDDAAGEVERALRSRGIPVARWRRLHRPGEPASAWPEEGPFEAAYVRLPKGREALELVLNAVGSRLVPGGRVWIGGANDEGIRSVEVRARELFGHVETVDARRHSRLLEATGPRPGLRGHLEDWAVTCEDTLPDGPLAWTSFPGVFAHGRLDEGTRLLLDHLPTPDAGARVLDFSCGAGLIAKVIGRRAPGVRLELLDIDALALEAARRNVPDAERIFASDGWENVGDAVYDVIVSNPPLHAGKGSSLQVVDQLVARAPAHLRPSGALWIVTQQTVALQDPLGRVFAEVDVAARGGGYKVWVGRRPRRADRRR